jgi:hypothetical protein
VGIDLVDEVGHGRRPDGADRAQPDVGRGVGEERGPAAQQQRDEMQTEFVDGPRTQVLPGDVRPSVDLDVLVAGRLAGSPQRLLDAPLTNV